MKTLQKIAIAKQIFTREELKELIKYETLSMFEIAKQHIEWFFYTIVVLIWIDFTALVFTLSKLPRYEQDIVIYQDTNSVEKKIEKYSEKKEQFNKVVKEIDNVSKSKLSSETIFFKVMAECNKWNINPAFVLALIETESDFNETVKAKDYATTKSIGWSQAAESAWETFNAQYVWPKYKEIYTLEDKNNVDKSLEFICWYLDWLKKYYPEKTKSPHDWYLTYNQGPNRKNNSQRGLANTKRFMNKFDKFYIAMNN